MGARHRQSQRLRLVYSLLFMAVALLGLAVPGLRIHSTIAFSFAGFVLVMCAVLVWLGRARTFRPWQFWLAHLADAISVAGLGVALGPNGSLAIVVLVFASAGYSLGMPRAAWLTLLPALVIYVPMRWLGYDLAQLPTPWPLILLEWVFFATFGTLLVRSGIVYSRRVRKVRRVLAALEAGDFTQRLSARTLDDLGFLSVSLDSMSTAVGGAMREIREQATALARVAESLAATSQEVNASAEYIGSTTAEIAHEAEAQQELIQGGSEQVTVLAAAGGELGAQAGATTASTGRLATEAADHAAGIGEATARLGALQNEFHNSARAVGELEAAGERVGLFVESIQQIAQQTHLLALNASIEAARAGEHGRGFAIVADEVRKLAGQAGESAESVAGVVEEIRLAIHRVRAQMAANATTLASVAEASGAGKASLDRLGGGLRQTVDLVEQVAAGVDLQSRTLRDLLEQMVKIQGIAERTREHAQQNAATTEEQVASTQELTAVSQQLADRAQQLTDLAQRFRIESA